MNFALARKATVTYFIILSQNLTEETEGKYENLSQNNRSPGRE
jgi:hypothetical protein